MASVSELLQGFLYDVTTNITNMDFFNKVVQFDDDPNNVASSEATYIFSGPPVLSPTGSYKGASGGSATILQLLEPLGAVQQFSLQEGKQVIPFRELGSKLQRQAVGYGQYSASMARVLTRYGNLAFGLYAWLYNYLSLVHKEANPSLDLALVPGEEGKKHYISPESELFNIPFGLLCVTGSAGGDVISAQYLERCYLQGGGDAKSAGQSLIVENVSILVTRPVAFVDRTTGNTTIPVKMLSKDSRNTFALQAGANNKSSTKA